MSTTASCLENLSLEEAKELFRVEKMRNRRLRRKDRKEASALLVKSFAEQVNTLQVQLFQDARKGLMEILMKLSEEPVQPNKGAELLKRLEFVGQQLAYIDDKLSLLLGENDFDSPPEA